jgi:hypothetical protein
MYLPSPLLLKAWGGVILTCKTQVNVTNNDDDKWKMLM